MTKFILHGGMTSVRNEENKKFHEEIVKDLPENPKILSCLFSINEDRWEEEFKWAQKNFIDNLERNDLKFQLASKEDFMSQVKWADAVHFRGGNTLKILEVLKKYPEFKNNLSGKTFSGSSAGALYLAENFYDQDHSEIIEGLGIIPINLITHYDSETYGPIDGKIIKELKNKNNRELVLIGECEYRVFEIDL
jgi:cyanophycinase-like exopeptidase